jgi:alpha-ketoglutarate-dependent taurine dioxygenase
MDILQNVIHDERLAWKKSLDHKIETLIIRLDEKSTNELSQKTDNLKFCMIEDFPNLQKEIEKLKNEFLINGNGFFIIDGNCFEGFNDEHVKEIYRLISTGLGELYVQNIKKEKFVIITDEGKSMSTGGRYHQTKEGGSFHTDSPQWSKVPDFVGLLCLRSAKIGGISKFVSVYTIHNQMLNMHPEYLDLLYTKFHFDKRGEFEENESPTTLEPIFKYRNNELMFRYLRNYIDAGQKIAQKPLTDEQNEVLDKLDKIIHDEKFSVSYDLKRFDISFFNNHRIIHGRTSFEDFDESEKKRYMIRTWIKNN